jgi:hypothetical protein
MGVEGQLGTGMSHQIDDALDIRDVTGNLDFQGNTKPGVGLGRRGHGGVVIGVGREGLAAGTSGR